MHKKIKSMLSIMLISTLSFTAVGCGNEASQEGVSAVFGTMESVLFITLPASNYPKILQIKRNLSEDVSSQTVILS